MRRLVRHAPDLLRGALLAAGVALLVTGELGGAYLVGAAVVAVAPRLARVAVPFDLAFGVAMGLNAAGYAFELYRQFNPFDEIAHTLTPLLMTPAVYAALAGALAFPSLRGRAEGGRGLAAGAIAAALAVSMAVLWEFFEWGLDAAFGTNFAPGYTDTMVDLALGTVGGSVAGALVILWGRHGWGGVRRR